MKDLRFTPLALFFRQLLFALTITLTFQVKAEVDSRPVILAIGESTTAGFGVAADESYPARLQALLDAAGRPYRVVNHGRSGSTTAMALSGLDRGMLLSPAVVVIALGGNDRSGRLDSKTTEQNLRKMVSMFKRAGAQVVLADRQFAGEMEADSLFAKLAREEGALLMPNLLARVAGKPELLLADGRHPNGEGYGLVAEQVYQFLAAELVWLDKP
jgi:acyl-CoA thioesterase I